MNRLAGKVALISGGAKGLGAAQVRGLANEGAAIVLGDVAEPAGRLIEQELTEQGHRVSYVRLDVTREADWQAAVATVFDRYGRLDILINNAGISLDKLPIEDMQVDQWDRVMAVNLRGPFLGIKHAIPALRAGGGGSIVNLSSTAGIGQSQLMEPAYAASKGGVRLLTKVIGTQHAHENIRCNSIHPGPIDGGMLHDRFTEDTLAQRLERVPMGRMGRMAEIVSGVIFLASDESSYMTGAELVIDGGAVAQ